MYEAIEMHVRGLVEDNFPVPKSHSFADYVAVPLSSACLLRLRTQHATITPPVEAR
jgi:hypothetical protein